jgi:long-chain acyl-CoA synthetase
MDKIWLKSYPPGMPAEINLNQYRSLVQLLEESFHKYAARNAYVCMDKFLTYAEVDAYSKRIGRLAAKPGPEKGRAGGDHDAQRAAVSDRDRRDPARRLHGGQRQPPLHPRELEHQLNDSGSEAIIVLENFATTLEQVLGRTQVKHIVVASMGEMLGGAQGRDRQLRGAQRQEDGAAVLAAERGALQGRAVAGRRSMKFTPVELNQGDVAFLQYTGGTTGVSKGATLTHRNIIANVLQSEAWSQPALGKDAESSRSTIVCALPLYHIFALTCCAMWGTRVGALNILIPNPRDIGGFIKELSKYKFNMLPAVNTLYNALLNHPEFRSRWISRA